MNILRNLISFVLSFFTSSAATAVTPIALLIADAVEPRIETLLSQVGIDPKDIDTILTGIEHIVADELANNGKSGAASAVALKASEPKAVASTTATTTAS